MRAELWSPLKTFAFRFALLYFALYALPFPFTNLLSTIATAYREIEGTLPGWIVEAFEYLNVYREAWQHTTSWLSEKGIVPFEVIHQSTGSGDTAHAYTKVFVSVIVSFAFAVSCSIFLSTRARYAQLAQWLHLAARWYLCFNLLGYGAIKIYSSQFGYPNPYTMTMPFGDSSPMGLVWNFMGFSAPYEVISGLGEAVGALLLVWRRTSLAGCLILIPVMSNVVMLNVLYGVPVKLFSGHLLLFSIALTLPYGPRLWAVIANRSAPPALDLRLTRVAWLRKFITLFGVVWIGTHIATTHNAFMERRENSAARRANPELYGIWKVEAMSLDGERVPLRDSRRWRYFAVDRAQRSWSVTYFGMRRSFLTRWDLEGGSAKVWKPKAGGRSWEAKPPEDAATWKVTLGTATRKVPNREGKTREARQQRIPMELRTLQLRGTWEEKELVLNLVEKRFNLERGFRWIQELPR